MCGLISSRWELDVIEGSSEHVDRYSRRALFHVVSYNSVVTEVT